MYIAKYKISDTLYNRIHVTNCEKSIRKDNVQELISYTEDTNWRRFKTRSKNTLVVIRRYNDTITKFGAEKYDIFYNKVEQLFCIGNNLDYAYSMKTHKIRYRKRVCKLKRIGCA